MSYVIGDKAFQLLPLKSLVNAGAMCSLSSDWDADPLDPMGTLNLAINRPYTEDSISLEQAVAMATLDAAAAMSHSNETGSIEVGKFADFVVLDANIFDTVQRDESLETVSVLQTVLSGLSVYTSETCGDDCLPLVQYMAAV